MSMIGLPGGGIPPALQQNPASITRRPMDVEDYVDLARRHKSWILGPTFLGLVVSVVVAFLWPDTFTSRATMRVLPPTVPQNVIGSASTLQIGQRLEGLRTQILSRGNLQALILDSKLNLYPKLRNTMTLEDAVDKMAKDVKIEFLGLTDMITARRVPTAFEVRFSYPDRFIAQRVVLKIVGDLTQQNTVLQSDSARGTSLFVGDELKEAEKELATQTEAMAKFKVENAGRLPESANSNAAQMSSLQMRINAADDKVARLQAQRNTLQTALETQQDWQTLVAQGPEESAPVVTLRGQALARLDEQIRMEQARLDTLLQSYSDSWPTVKTSRQLLNSLIKQRDEEQARQEASQPVADQGQKKGVSQYQLAQMKTFEGRVAQIKTEMSNITAEIASANREKGDLDKQMQNMQARIDSGPEVERRYAQLSRDMELAKNRYQDLKIKSTVTETAKNLEDRGLGERLDLVDPATVPQNPSEPNRWQITGVGVVIGILLGFGMAAAREARDTSLKNLKDVRAYTNLPVLTSIPLLESALLVRRRRRLAWLGWSSAVIVGILVMAAAVFYYYAPHASA
jgi:polysaccharide chain length determinant protein (PEP-CTERM system associated)